MLKDSIFVGIGGNLPGVALGPPLAVMQAAVAALAAAGLPLMARSSWYRSRPEPPSDQPPFVNGVLQLATALPPQSLLELLHELEARFGRVRSVPNAARILDLDLLAYGQIIMRTSGGLQLPHPRLHLRAFVLVPLVEIAPEWRHPVRGKTARTLLASLPSDHGVERLDPDEPAHAGPQETFGG